MSSPVPLGFSADEVVNNVNLGLVVVDRDLQILLWNDWMSRHSRIGREQALRQNIIALFGEQLTPGFLRALNNAIGYGLPAILSSAFHRSPLPLFVEQDKSDMPVRMHQSIIMTPLQSDDGQPTCLIQISDSSTSVKREKMLMSHSDALKREAITDSLTGIYNRRFFDESYALALRDAKRNHTSLSLLMIDIDYFKQYNDHYGHGEGDRALKLVANVLRAQMRRPNDVCARYGGEEFIMLIPGFTDVQAENFAERLRASVSDLCIQHEESQSGAHMTISVGVCTMTPDIGSDGAALLDSADDALYRAKKQGRNQVVSGV
ncbi:diguanylate cyclase [Herbaspirillum sp. meg3]|uniref:sensor domain-containing diguanylate cyclase n=1 Tax=Herbaspirillum sp. meg3 TaxID=2025949 RepID=UPI000B98437E|nr:diguanylate cyclase [Herbaspirillum sp. meg3]ASU39741.1 diguanylate cyclase [Herbaspirillum sp. meg3]